MRGLLQITYFCNNILQKEISPCFLDLRLGHKAEYKDVNSSPLSWGRCQQMGASHSLQVLLKSVSSEKWPNTNMAAVLLSVPLAVGTRRHLSL
jgi:hypothetical protein